MTPTVFGSVGLKAWQTRGVEKIVKAFETQQAVLNASDLGTGKTYTALAVAILMGKRILVIAPKNTHSSWKRSAESMGAPEGCLLDVMTIDLLRRGKTPWLDSNHRWTMPLDGMVVWDEFQLGVSGISTQASAIMAKLKAYKIPTLCMSGTPASSPLQLRALGYLMGLCDYEISKFYSWVRAHGCTYNPNFRGWMFNHESKSGRDTMDRIYQQLEPRMYRARISEIPEFPKRETQINLYDLNERATEDINKAYADMEKEIASKYSTPMVAKMKCRQAAEFIKVPLLVELTQEYLNAGKSVVVFLNFVDPVKQMLAALQAVNISAVGLVGEMSQEQREASMDAFQANRAHVFVCTAGSGSTGVNLHDIHQVRERVALITPGVSAALLTQTRGRIYRQGGTNALEIIVLAGQTCEESVWKKLRAKLNNMSALLGDEDMF